MGKTVFVSGLAGYLGECLGRELDRGEFCDRFYGIDVKPPLSKYDRGEFRRLDVTGKSAAAWIREIRPDVLIHMAFVVTPVHDENLMHRVNVSGTRNVMEAALAAGVKQIMVTSSGTAYGAFPDNPVPLSETDPIRRHPDFPYARDKAEVEAYLSDFQAKHPETKLCWVRPSVIYGPSVNNYISDLFTLPVARMVGPEGKVVGSLDGVRVFKEGYPGAIYLHQTVSYQVRDLDFTMKRVNVAPRTADYYTRARSEKRRETIRPAGRLDPWQSRSQSA